MQARQKSLREARHIDKSSYLGADARFYESSYGVYSPSDEFVVIVRAAIEASGRPWRIHRVGVWSHVVGADDPQAPMLPAQGWKIHLSATEESSRRILQTVAALALQAGILFKFANDTNTLRMMSSKRWPRGGSGKFITLYPVQRREFETFIETLYCSLKNEVGSYILSDKRYKDCRCLYYRYGGMRQIHRRDFMGQNVPMLIAPDGRHVPDVRNPYFDLPAWETDPFPSEDPAEEEMTLHDGRYLIRSALGFSNTGGVYLALDRQSGRDVVIKEARPHVELHGNGLDATLRLQREQRNLELLGPIGVSPAIIETFWDWENFYLVEEHLDAFDLREIMLKRSPLLRARPTLADSREFYATYVEIFMGLLAAIERAHAAGVVIGDLSPPNVLVRRADLAVRIIDLEAAFLADSGESDDIHTPGFRRIMKGRKRASCFNDDVYAAAAVMLYSMFPIVALAYIRDDLFEAVLPTILHDIGWQQTPVARVISGLAASTLDLAQARALLGQPAEVAEPFAPLHRARGSAAACVQRMARYINQHCRLMPERTLFPLDPYAGHTNTASLGFGAAGVVYALNFAGCELRSDAAERYAAECAGIDPAVLPPGFLTGHAGLAWVALAQGRAAAAAAHLEVANASELASAHHSLYYGMAGLGLANLAVYLATARSEFLDAALRYAQTLEATALSSERGVYWQDAGGTRIGLGYGQAGVALFLLRLSQVTKLDRWRALGDRALSHDLSYGFELEPGVITFPCAPEEVNTYEPYIEQGSAGIAKVAIRFGRWEDVDRLLVDAHRKYSGFCGLIYGLAGLLDVFVDAYVHSGDVRYEAMARRPFEGICDLYLMHEGDASAVPGENLFRISFDYATGIAGVMRTLHRYAHALPDDLFLDQLDGLLPGRTPTQVDGSNHAFA